MTDAAARLKPNEAALWLMRVDAAAAARLTQAGAPLDDAERARALRLRDVEARAQFVAGRALLRRMALHHAGEAARGWRLRIDAAGRPAFDAPTPDYVFSLSHTRGLVACALARGGDIGVDVEAVAPAEDLVALARQNFSAREAADVAALSGAARVEAFFAYWTLKEAYAKARGLGLTLDMRRFAFDLDAPIAVRFAPGFDDEAGRWRFLRVAPTPDARLALAAAAPIDLTTTTPRWIAPQTCL